MYFFGALHSELICFAVICIVTELTIKFMKNVCKNLNIILVFLKSNNQEFPKRRNSPCQTNIEEHRVNLERKFNYSFLENDTGICQCVFL